MIDGASFTDVVDGLLVLVGCVVVGGAVVCFLFGSPDDDRGC